MKVKHSPLYYVYQVFNTVFLALVSLTCILPILHVFAMSLSDSNAALAGRVTFWPVQFSLSAYEYLIQKKDFFHSVSISAWRVLIGTLINMVLIVLTAYPLSRPATHFKARKWYMLYFSITMFIGGGLIPTYMTVTKTLHMGDTFWVMLLPFCVHVFNLIIMRTFFESSIPQELWEAAQLDGCSSIYYLGRVVLPLSKAVLSVIMLYYVVAKWNEYFTALIYIRNNRLIPLQIVLRDILIQNESMASNMMGAEAIEAAKKANLIKYSSIIVGTLPMMILYPFLQKYFEKGVMIGAVKG